MQCALWLGITYKANFANYSAANGWIGRADRLLAPLDPGPLHGYALVARAYRMTDLAGAEELTRAGGRRSPGRPATSISSWGRCPSSG